MFYVGETTQEPTEGTIRSKTTEQGPYWYMGVNKDWGVV